MFTQHPRHDTRGTTQSGYSVSWTREYRPYQISVQGTGHSVPRRAHPSPSCAPIAVVPLPDLPSPTAHISIPILTESMPGPTTRSSQLMRSTRNLRSHQHPHPHPWRYQLIRIRPRWVRHNCRHRHRQAQHDRSVRLVARGEGHACLCVYIVGIAMGTQTRSLSTSEIWGLRCV